MRLAGIRLRASVRFTAWVRWGAELHDASHDAVRALLRQRLP